MVMLAFCKPAPPPFFVTASYSLRTAFTVASMSAFVAGVAGGAAASTLCVSATSSAGTSIMLSVRVVQWCRQGAVNARRVSPSHAMTSDDRRVARRFQQELEIDLHARDAKEERVRLRVFDVSRHGMFVERREPPPE